MADRKLINKKLQVIYEKYGFDLKRLKLSSIPWLPAPTTVRTPLNEKETDVEDFFQLRDEDLYQSIMWSLLELSIPPLLAKKYHSVSIRQLLEDKTTNFGSASIAAWFTTFLQGYGPSYLLDVVEFSSNALSCSFDVDSFDYKEKDLEEHLPGIEDCYTAMALHYVTPHVKVLDKEDTCIGAKDFLLEPCILIQLPWNVTLYHQWLVAALVEVLVFERDAAELKSWPVARPVTKCAQNILLLVRNLKERLTLGMDLFLGMPIGYRRLITKQYNVHKIIMDTVVVPSLPPLKLLISGMARRILKSIKKYSWPANTTMDDLGEVIDEATHFMNKDVDYKLADCFYLPTKWLEGDMVMIETFGAFSSKEINQMVRLLRKNRQTLTSKSNNELITRWRAKLMQVVGDEFVNCNNEDINITKKAIITHIIDKGRIPELSLQTLERYLGNKPLLMLARINLMAGFDAEKSNELDMRIHLLRTMIKISLKLNWIQKMLLNSHKLDNPSALSQLIMLSFQVTERELICELVVAVCLTFHYAPLCINMGKYTPEEIGKMESALEATNSDIKSWDRDWLFSQLPKEWRQDVSHGETAPDFSGGNFDVEAIAKSFEERIGSLVYNAAQQNFEVTKKIDGTANAYRYWPEVQYLLPCLVAAMVKDSVACKEGVKTAQQSFNFALLLHHLLLFYEQAFLDWLAKPTPIERYCTPDWENKTISDCNAAIKEYDAAVGKMVCDLKVLLAAFTSASSTGELDVPGLSNVIELVWCFPFKHLKFQHFMQFQPCVTSSYHFARRFLTMVLQCCQNAWLVPSPMVDTTSTDLQSLYFASFVLAQLGFLFEVNMWRNETSPTDDITDTTKKLLLQLPKHRINVLKAVLDPKSCSDLSEFLSVEKSYFRGLYNKLKEFRRHHKVEMPTFVTSVLPEVPVFKNAVALYVLESLSALDVLLAVFEITPSHQCRHCGTAEGSLTPCDQCVTDKYPDVNYFCSEACRDARWQKTHYGDHLEYELGLGDFVNPEREESE